MGGNEILMIKIFWKNNDPFKIFTFKSWSFQWRKKKDLKRQNKIISKKQTTSCSVYKHFSLSTWFSFKFMCNHFLMTSFLGRNGFCFNFCLVLQFYYLILFFCFFAFECILVLMKFLFFWCSYVVFKTHFVH